MDLRLRDHRPGDLPAVLGWAGDATVTERLTFGPFGMADAAAWLDAAVAEVRERPRRTWSLAIEVRGEVVGVVVVSTDSVEHHRAEVGFAVRSDRWGEGIATAAVGRACALALGSLGFHRVWAVCDPENPAAARVLVANGFAEEGRLRDDLRIGSRWRDSVLFARIARR